jgi:hypothetical protein
VRDRVQDMIIGIKSHEYLFLLFGKRFGEAESAIIGNNNDIH